MQSIEHAFQYVQILRPEKLFDNVLIDFYYFLMYNATVTSVRLIRILDRYSSPCRIYRSAELP